MPVQEINDGWEGLFTFPLFMKFLLIRSAGKMPLHLILNLVKRFPNLYMSNHPQSWFIIKRPTGHCEVVPSDRTDDKLHVSAKDRWGPFPSQEEAFARRIGLIRAGKCQPM
jgi:hypothetical protein